ncbi:MAG: glutamate racemase [FCB group bacterium]|nr:glutamate racemase [FCB group bacterium]
MNKGSEAPIGIFDSGLGGLTVLQAMVKLLPQESYLYFGDTAHVPYGSKSNETVLKYADQITEFLIRQKVKLIVVACNTASSVALTGLKKKYDIPIIGVVEPAVRRAAELTKSRTIGVIGTRATIRSGSYQNLIQRELPEARTIAKACPLFVSLVEEGWENTAVAREVAGVYLSDILKNGMDTLILGCTHYPVLMPTIREIVTDKVNLISSGEAVAQTVRDHLMKADLLSDNRRPSETFYITDLPQLFDELGSRFLGRRLENVKYIQPL